MTPEPPRVAAICGSLRRESLTRVALEEALEGAAAAGAAHTDLIDLAALDLPLINPEQDDPPAVVELRERVARADAILLGTPMYHGSFSAPLKNALDHCGFDEFSQKTVGLLAVAGGAFPLPALEHLRGVCRSLNAWVLPYQAAVPRAGATVRDGRFTDDALAERVRVLGRRAVQFARIGPDPATPESRENVGAEGK